MRQAVGGEMDFMKLNRRAEERASIKLEAVEKSL
jgi:hypothetical protein